MGFDFGEWLNLGLRWLHLITGIAWIGSSFYFVWLDNHLTKPAAGDASGELWSVHGGGFYHNQKYQVAPAAMPEHLHWFKWEAYFTWMSGFALLALVYYAGAESFLIDPAKADLSPAGAIGIGLVISFVLALLIRSRAGLYQPILGITGTLYAIPSLALFALLTPVTGVGTVTTAEIALVSYTLLILTRNIVEGLRGVPAEAIEAATGMGFTGRQRLMRVELPLALPIIIAGLRIATVTTVGLVTVTALTGLGGLGYLIVNLGTARGSFGLTPALTRPHIMWSADTLAVTNAAR